MKNKIFIIPGLIFFLILLIFFYLLTMDRNPSEIPSNLLNTSKLTAGIQESAEKFGLSIDAEAATILAGVDTSSSSSISITHCFALLASSRRS